MRDYDEMIEDINKNVSDMCKSASRMKDTRVTNFEMSEVSKYETAVIGYNIMHKGIDLYISKNATYGNNIPLPGYYSVRCVEGKQCDLFEFINILDSVID